MYIMYFLFCSISHIFLDNIIVQFLRAIYMNEFAEGCIMIKQKALQCTCDALVGLTHS